MSNPLVDSPITERKINVSQTEVERQLEYQDQLSQDKYNYQLTANKNAQRDALSNRIQLLKEQLTEAQDQLSRLNNQIEIEIENQGIVGYSIDTLTGEKRAIGKARPKAEPEAEMEKARTYNSATRQFEDILVPKQPKKRMKSLVRGQWI